MYERLLDKNLVPTVETLITYCGENGKYFEQIYHLLTNELGLTSEIRFPYGNNYGWSVTYRKNKKLICDIFAEDGAFTVMIRLSGKQFDHVYEEVSDFARESIDHKYPCGDGGYLHYRVLDDRRQKDIITMLKEKCK